MSSELTYAVVARSSPAGAILDCAVQDSSDLDSKEVSHQWRRLWRELSRGVERCPLAHHLHCPWTQCLPTFSDSSLLLLSST